MSILSEFLHFKSCFFAQGNIFETIPFADNYTFSVDFPLLPINVDEVNTGWNTKADGSGKVYTSDDILGNQDEDLHVFPVLMKGNYVRFSSEGGSPVRSQFVFPEQKATEPVAPTREGIFTGEPIDFASTDITMPAKNLIFYACWEKLKVEATFDAVFGTIDGQQIAVQTTNVGGYLSVPETPEAPEGMEFYCWTPDGKKFDFSDPITEELYLIAAYRLIVPGYSLEYSVGDGSEQAGGISSRIRKQHHAELFNIHSVMKK